MAHAYVFYLTVAEGGRKTVARLWVDGLAPDEREIALRQVTRTRWHGRLRVASGPRGAPFGFRLMLEHRPGARWFLRVRSELEQRDLSTHSDTLRLSTQWFAGVCARPEPAHVLVPSDNGYMMPPVSVSSD